MLRALPKSQQARWLEIGRVFERVRQLARAGEHVVFTPVAEAGAAGEAPAGTRFPSRTARIPSARRPTYSGATNVPSEETWPGAAGTSVAPAAAENSSAPAMTGAGPTSSPENSPPTSFAEAATDGSPATPAASPAPATSAADATRQAPEPAAAASPVEPADFSLGELPSRRRATPASDWSGWSSYAIQTDLGPSVETAAESPEDAMSAEPPPPAAGASPTDAPLPPTAVVDSAVPPPPGPAPESPAKEGSRVSAVEYFRAAPW